MTGEGAARAASHAGTVDTERTRWWSGRTLLQALETAAAHLEAHVAAINALNVFPVPDGDTGTNLFLTLQAAVREARRHALDGQPPRADEVLAGAAHGALMGARGNSGVILYQILAGMAEGSQGASHLDGHVLAASLRRGADLAYRAVGQPVEGTMLTVIREAAEAAETAAVRDGSVASVLAAALDRANDAVARTPALLDILQQAGVVDAGGQGLAILLGGLQRFVDGATLAISPADAPPAAAMAFLDHLDELHGTAEFGYCINFLLSGDALPVEEVRRRIAELGTSTVAVGDATMLKIHVHSDHPGAVLELALTYGELHQVRIDNMTAQTRALVEARAADHPPVPAAPTAAPTSIGLVAVASGAGLTAALRGMGADAVVPGGPTVNPSTAEILRAVEALPHREVILLPNDPNVIPTARQVERLTERIVRVVPSRSVPEGISALAAFNFDAGLDENVAAMTEALSMVRSLALTRATRAAEIDGVRVRAGQYIGLVDGRLRAAGDDAVSVTLAVVTQAQPEQAELLTLFVGEPAAPDLAGSVAAAIGEAYPHLTIEVAAGDQPHYDLIMALE
ncbi:MAG: DAK2 domain-containing protein [Sphaerobacter sp.]|nr:DAK2 domain-containing protein [Sphaerobacter sp.]